MDKEDTAFISLNSLELLNCWDVYTSFYCLAVNRILCRQDREKVKESGSGWLSLQVQVRTQLNSWLYGSSCAIINSNSREREEGAKLYVIQWESTTASSSVWNLWWSVLKVTILTDQKSVAGKVQIPWNYMWRGSLMNGLYSILILPNSCIGKLKVLLPYIDSLQKETKQHKLW